MSEEKALVPLQEKRVDFYGDEIPVILLEVNGRHQVYVPAKSICDYLGLAWSSQLQRMKRDDVIAEGLVTVSLSNTEVGQRYSQRYNVICLQLELLPGWLFGISPARVRADLHAPVSTRSLSCPLAGVRG